MKKFVYLSLLSLCLSACSGSFNTDVQHTDPANKYFEDETKKREELETRERRQLEKREKRA